MRSISEIVMVFTTGNEAAGAFAGQATDWLAGLGRRVRVVESPRDAAHDAGVWDGADMVLTLGGDGTLLAAARAVLDHGIPILGLNLGNVGFLTELSPEDWRESLGAVIDGGYEISSRLVIRFHVLREGREYYQGYAVNDLVIGCGSLAKLVRMDMWYGSDHLGMVRADGMIVATPTGSSGYSISAGGPLVYPELDVFALTPICPFLHAFRPMILPFEEDLRILLQGGAERVFLTQDGQTGVALMPGDEVVAFRAARRLQLVRPVGSHYAHKLKSKGFIRES